MQRQVGRQDYEAWWNKVASVDLQTTQAVESQRQVNIVLTHNMKDGTAKHQSERITLEPSGSS